jgi:exonuclease SbcC
MIINRVRARNVLKYAALSIDLADKGLIAISGANESGKSSIGETICFALFGRTFSIPPEQLQKVVRWGENECEVTLTFSVEDRQYVLSRRLDHDGNQSARLATAARPDEPLARGVRQVADALFGLIGFEYEQFVDSFYLAQREITTPHPHSQAVKIMAGVAPLEQAAKTIEGEAAEREELIAEIQTEWEAAELDVKALGIRDGHLAQVEDRRHAVGERRREVDAVLEALESGTEQYTANLARSDQLRRALARNGILRIVALLLGLLAGGLWALVNYGGEVTVAETARQVLARFLPATQARQYAPLAYAAVALFAVALLLWVRIAGLRANLLRLRGASAGYADVLARARAIEFDPGSSSTGGQGDDPARLPMRPDPAEYRALHDMLQRGEAAGRMAQDFSMREAAWLAAVAQADSRRIDDLDAAIDEEQGRLQEALNLSDVLNGLTDKRDDVRERIGDRQRALELLRGAIDHLARRFNRDVKTLVGRMLPLFTDSRYEHLQLDDALNVRVFSNDKRDFMGLDEVSSATQRQIMLALRLALSQKLLGRTVKGRQFVFLDEPFAFFDEQRTRRALKALARLGDDVSQVWIVMQAFPVDCEVAFDTVVRCERGVNSLEVVT